RWSAGLGLPVLPLPDEAGHLAEAMTSAVRDGSAKGRVVALVGASGGLGVSTLVASLALTAADRRRGAAAVDLAQGGGGLDLLVGAEATAGVRWPDLGHARGELGDLIGALPAVANARFLAQGRDASEAPPDAAVSAAVGALRRAAALVVVDAGREPPPVECDQVLLVVGADVRSVASARMLADARGLTPSGLVVRQGPGRAIPAEVIARSLGVSCLGTIGHDKAVPRLAELGMLPIASAARRYRRQVAALVKEITDA
ncbi:MAG: hypothetical protein Q4F67_15765, partial [Propionibacteriaceae bacterium]|nr:hypothetical protein [Propionibacteriaceae bacterium]